MVQIPHLVEGCLLFKMVDARARMQHELGHQYIVRWFGYHGRHVRIVAEGIRRGRQGLECYTEVLCRYGAKESVCSVEPLLGITVTTR